MSSKAKHKRVPDPSPTRLRLATATAAAAALTGGLFVAGATTASAATTEVAASDADFNNDGYADLAVSASHAYVNGKANAGQIGVVYGGAATTKKVVLSQNSPGVPGTAETGDYFGADSAYGDFDGDGYDDLLVGAPTEDVGSDKDGGTAAILWGSANGLTSGTTVADPRPTAHDGFGGPVEAGDFDGDGRTDLAIASNDKDTIDILSGGFSRTSGAAKRAVLKVPVISDTGAGVWNLHSGDANHDGKDDLIVNGYAKDNATNANFWLPGTSSGPSTSGSVRLPTGVITDLGDTDSDGYDDIVVGNYWSASGGKENSGAVYVIHGTPSGPDTAGRTTFTQNVAGVPGSSETGDNFGTEVDLGDVNGDGHLDLVVGAPGEDLTGGTNTGAAWVLYGKADGTGITAQGSLFLDQNTAGVANDNEKNDWFGADVHIDDLNADGRGELYIGTPGENGNGAVYPVNIKADGTLSAAASGIYTSTFGISATGTPHLGANFTD
ncbi:FG-GAP and VCBS repeat-containing protein [Streptomyces sp. NPDC046716]|uniref:FG-GAP and VCBS repeat-containing protein n=1 Tax=Streptomyces sp. NPDC046716 TaxID=3157093 RepID=UPI003403BCCB